MESQESKDQLDLRDQLVILDLKDIRDQWDLKVNQE